jgi:putative ABC transport system ATP-binding protein
MTTVEATGLTKVFRQGRIEVTAVRDVDLLLQDGEMVAVMGPSGSGKTTLLSMLGCILRPSAGRLRIGGRDVTVLSERTLPDVRRQHIGFIFQSFNLFSALTVSENVQVAFTLKGADGTTARRESARLVEQVGLTERGSFLPRDLSGGEKQRVSIARALAGEPRLILADEPTANLDSANGEQVMKLLRRAADSDGRSVVVVTHDHRVLPHADRVVHIHDGRVVP